MTRSRRVHAAGPKEKRLTIVVRETAGGAIWVDIPHAHRVTFTEGAGILALAQHVWLARARIGEGEET